MKIGHWCVHWSFQVAPRLWRDKVNIVLDRACVSQVSVCCTQTDKGNSNEQMKQAEGREKKTNKRHTETEKERQREMHDGS